MANFKSWTLADLVAVEARLYDLLVRNRTGGRHDELYVQLKHVTAEIDKQIAKAIPESDYDETEEAKAQALAAQKAKGNQEDDDEEFTGSNLDPEDDAE